MSNLENLSVKVSGSWRDVEQAYIKVSGSWREAKPYMKINGSWREMVFYDGFVYTGSGIRPIEKGFIRKVDMDGNLVWFNERHSDEVVGVAADNDGYVYSASNDETVRKTDPNGNQVWSFTGHSNRLNDVDIDNDGYVYSASNDGTACKISPNGNQVWSVDNGGIPAIAVTAHPDGSGAIVSWSGTYNNSSVRAYNSGGSYVRQMGMLRIVQDLCSDNDYIYAGNHDGYIEKYETSGQQVWRHKRLSDRIVSIDVGDDGSVYLAAHDGTVRKYNSNGSHVWSYSIPDSGIQRPDAVSVDPLGNVYAGFSGRGLRKLDPNGNDTWVFTDPRYGYSYDVPRALATSPK